MHLKCDYREKSCIDVLKSHNVDFEIENLSIGDFIIYNKDRTQSIVIERKTMDDLSMSIIDSRYKDQTTRLQSIKTENVRILIIIETFHKTTQKGLEYDSLLSSMMSMCVKYGFYLMRTKDVSETCKCIMYANEKMDSVNNTNNTIVNTIIKKDHSTKTVYLNMLCCIPGISIKIATSISEKYPTFQCLLDSFKLNGMHMLTDIDKIGKKKSENFYKYICSVE